MTSERGQPQRFAPLLRLALAATALLALIAWLRRRFVRFEVAGGSMLPAFREGDYLLARRFGPGDLPRPGQAVLASDPRLPGRTLLKRVAAVDLHGQATLVGDNSAESTDSRHFGAVPAEAIFARVVWRYWPLIRR